MRMSFPGKNPQEREASPPCDIVRIAQPWPAEQCLKALEEKEQDESKTAASTLNQHSQSDPAVSGPSKDKSPEPEEEQAVAEAAESKTAASTLNQHPRFESHAGESQW